MSPNHTQPPASVFILEEQTGLTLDELCQACTAHTEFIAELVEEGVLTPAGQAPDQWRFTGIQLRHASVAVRLQRDLGVNVAGAALALQLLDELETLRARLRATGSAA
ncbi:MAG: MerR family transcriptional regulator [Burkholderiaceae bacterium]|nr:MAG: MerR family transcriptional regulator [Burkholderiaceae bacterium]